MTKPAILWWISGPDRKRQARGRTGLGEAVLASTQKPSEKPTAFEEVMATFAPLDETATRTHTQTSAPQMAKLTTR